jgi:hypothetical protein
MAYRSLPKFDPSAHHIATARLPVFNGVRMKPGDALPPSPEDPGAARRHARTLRQLYELRKIVPAPVAHGPEPKKPASKRRT